MGRKDEEEVMVAAFLLFPSIDPKGMDGDFPSLLSLLYLWVFLEEQGSSTTGICTVVQTEPGAGDQNRMDSYSPHPVAMVFLEVSGRHCRKMSTALRKPLV